MKQFRLVDNVMGWLAFFIAAFVYCSTIEPTASFWDCPEFITTGYKLEVGHPPGAPFFMLTANLFSQFASDPSTVASMVNTMNALLSAACIMFLFWTITHLVRRLLTNNMNDLDMPKLIAIEASGLVGALIYTFSDTFWYSAVEGEVYAYSSAFTAVVFWLILKWEEHADEPHSDRWLVLIMYMTGLSIGVHLLNLLCLPAIVLVWYYKRFPNANLKGSLVALGVSVVLLAAVLYGVVPGIITVGGWFEWFFVNDLGMPFNTGLYIYIVLLVGCVLWAIYETQNANEKNWKRQNIAFLLGFALLGVPFYGYGLSAFFIGLLVLAIVAWGLFYKVGSGKNAAALISARLKNTTLLCMLMLMIGYSTYAVIVIRSSANPPMDQNSPEDIFTLGNYLSRDQYGYRPLLYGQTFASEGEVADDGMHYKFTEGAPIIQQKEKAHPDDKDEYFVADHKRDLVYAQNVFFPRMYSSQHADFYKSWHGGITGREVPSKLSDRTLILPTFADNLSFFITYQCNFMYWRYFLWNFAGRQNDIQGHGELEHGNWISGIPFIDNMMLGDQSLLPDELKNNKGHNVFYCLPLLLGLIGLFWQMLARGRKGIQQFWVVFFLFFMTGLAIVLYLNQTPMQPRERDYAYAGSFYAYAIWCGMGVAAIISWLCSLFEKKKQLASTVRLAVAGVVSVVCLLVPIQMASQTWDDHDRSGRYTCRDFGQNYLMSLQQTNADGQPSNPVIFTNGDNDTFPLWYNMDTEGVRTDARVCNLSYLQTDWYIDQMVRPAYDSPSLPITWPRLQYCSGTNEFVRIDPRLKLLINFLQQAYPTEAAEIFGDDPFELKNVMKYWVRSDMSNEESTRMANALQVAISRTRNPEYFADIDMHAIPSDTVYLDIDREAVLRSNMLVQGDSIPERMAISLSGMGGLEKNKLMMLEMLANANWERPLYVAMTVGSDNYMSLGNHFVQEGLAYRITPFNTRAEGMTDFDIAKVYDNVMNRFKFGGINQPGVYLDETVMRMCLTHRQLMVELANRLVQAGDSTKIDIPGDTLTNSQRAERVLARMEQEIPPTNVPYDMDSRIINYQGHNLVITNGASYTAANLYIMLGQKEKAKPILDYFWNRAKQYMAYYMSLDQNRFRMSNSECLKQFSQMLKVASAYYEIDQEKAEQLDHELSSIIQQFTGRGGDAEAAYWQYM